MLKKIINLFILFILFLFAFNYFLYGTLCLCFPYRNYDDAIVLYGAELVSKGKIPYRDFWTIYSPGVFYLLAFNFKLFGVTLGSSRILSAIILTLVTISIYIVIEKLSNPLYALIGFLLSVLYFKKDIAYLRAYQVAFLFCILSSLILWKYLDNEKKRWIFISGVLNGIVFLFRYDFGFYNFIAISICLIIKDEKNFQQIKKNLFLLIIGNLFMILPFIVYLIKNNAFLEMINVFIFSLLVYPKYRNLPYPELNLYNLILYFPIFTFLFTCIKLLLSQKTKKYLLITFYLFLGLGLFIYASVRFDYIHILPSLITAIIISIILIEDIINKSLISLMIRKKIINIAMIIIFLRIFYSFFIQIDFIEERFLQKNNSLKIELPRAKGFYDNSPELARIQLRAIQYIQKNTASEEKIFVGNIRHDKLVNNDILFYFLSERNSATKYYELNPGLTNTYPIQKRIINDLINNNVRYIVLCDFFLNRLNEPNESNKSSGINLLDRFIRNNYKFLKITGNKYIKYIILLKK